MTSFKTIVEKLNAWRRYREAVRELCNRFPPYPQFTGKGEAGFAGAVADSGGG